MNLENKLKSFEDYELQLAGLQYVCSFGYDRNIFREQEDNGNRYVFMRSTKDKNKVLLTDTYKINKGEYK